MLRKIVFYCLYQIFSIKILSAAGLKVLIKINVYCEFSDEKLANLINKLIKDEKAQRIFLSGTGILMILSRERVFMIPTGSHNAASLERSYKNHKEFGAVLGELSDYQFIREISNTGLIYYRQERLYPLNNDDMKKIIDQCLKKLQILTGECSMLGLEEQKKGIDVLTERLTNPRPRHLLRKLIERYQIIHHETVYSHGDLTPSNIMKNAKGKPVLIDLDRMTMHNFSFIDKIHFDLAVKSEESKLSPYTVLNELAKNQSSQVRIDSFFSYLLFRVGVEHREGVCLPTEYYNQIERIIHTLSEMDK
jgi:hypothetical protein